MAELFRHHPLPGDIAAVRQLVAGTQFFSAEEIEIAVELITDRVDKGEASGYHFVLAEEGGDLVGYTCYGRIPGTKASYDLYWIGVAASYQRNGIGRRLLSETQHCIAAAGGQRVYVETSGRPQYFPTRAFYERCGYRCEAVLEDFYAPGDSKCIFVKTLPPSDPLRSA